MTENNSPPIETIETTQTNQTIESKLDSNGNGEIIFTGSPYCRFKSAPSSKHICSNRSVPGSNYCGPHGGRLTTRPDGTLGMIGPGTYRAIAQLAEMNNRYVSQVLQGKANPTSKVLDRIAKVVGISVERLVGFIEEQKLLQEQGISDTILGTKSDTSNR